MRVKPEAAPRTAPVGASAAQSSRRDADQARFFDTLGRKIMISGTYILSGALLAVIAYLFDKGHAHHGHPDHRLGDHLLLRLSRRQGRLPDRQRDLPDETPRNIDRVQHPAATDGAGTGPAAGTGQRRQRRRIEPTTTAQASYRHCSPMHPPYAVPLIDTARSREVDEILAALSGQGPIERRRLAQLVHADLWGPEPVQSRAAGGSRTGQIRRTSRGQYALVPQLQIPVRIRRPLTTPSTPTEPASGHNPETSRPSSRQTALALAPPVGRGTQDQVRKMTPPLGVRSEPDLGSSSS
jgi:hypothetical protein